MPESTIRSEEAGFVAEAKEYLITLEGLPSIRINDVIVNERGNRAIVMGLRDDRVEALLLDRIDLRVGERFSFRDHGIKFPLGDDLYGRIFNPVGDTIDGKGSLSTSSEAFFRLEVVAPGMNARQGIKRQFETGIAVVDTLLPLSFGQRQLIVGPTGSGKTPFLEDIVINQRDTDVICIYALIGKPVSYIQDVIYHLFGKQGNQKTIIIAALSEETSPMIFVAPSVAFSVAEHFSSQGKDVLLILDDLGTHAKYLREIALLSGRIPGRESYPGDIFYQHAHLMERAGQFNKTVGNGSITLLPVLETNIEDLSNLIATNLMAATDGHLFFQPDLYAQGYHPSISTTQSVTRIGRKTQTALYKELSIKVMALLADYEKQLEYSRFGTQLSEETQRMLRQGAHVRAVLKQETFTPVSLEIQAILLGLVFTPMFVDKEPIFIEKNRQNIFKVVSEHDRFADLRKTARKGSLSLSEFIKRISKEISIVEAACRL